MASSFAGPPTKKRRTAQSGLRPTHSRLDDDDLEVVHSRNISQGPRYTRETHRSPQKGQTSWTASKWPWERVEDIQYGLEDDEWEDLDFGNMGADAQPPVRIHKVKPPKKKTKHWVSAIKLMFCVLVLTITYRRNLTFNGRSFIATNILLRL